MVNTFIIVVFCCGLFNLSDSFALLRQRIPRQECKNITNVTFLTFLPCLQESSDNLAEGVSIFERLDSCDILTRAAVELAVERVNQNAKLGNQSQRFLSLTLLHGVYDPVGSRDLPAVSHQLNPQLKYSVQ